MSAHPILHTLVKDPREVRHLLIHSVEGPSVTTLSQLIAGVQTRIATGTEYEMSQKADALMQEGANDGFRHLRERELVFESLKRTVTLVTVMGYSAVYDPQHVDLPGAVPLSQWSGRIAKDGGDYEYALDGRSIVAQPILPPNHGLNLRPATNAEFLTVMRDATKLRDALGPTVNFILAD